MNYSLREFLEVKSAAGAGFSPDGRKVLVLSNLPGTMQLYRVSRGGGPLAQITDFSEPVFGRYSPVADEILLTMDEGGNERTQLSLVGDDGSGFRFVVRDPEYLHYAAAFTRDGKTLTYTSNRRNGTDFDVYVRDLASGQERCAFEMGGWCQGAGFSPDGRWLAVIRLTDRNADNELYLVDLVADTVQQVASHADAASVGAPSWLPDASAFFFATDIGSEFEYIARYDMASGEWRPVVERDWDLSCAVDWTGRTLAVCANEEGYSRYELYNPGTLERGGELPLPGRGIVASDRFSHDGRFIAYTFVSPREPGDVWLHDLDTHETTRLTESPRGVPAEALVDPELHRFESFDGESIPLFLFRPSVPGDAPVVVYIHGGPESQFVPGWNPVIQYLVHSGYAVVAPNVRGSTGYGKRFHHLDDVRNRLDSVRDLESLHGWLMRTPGLDAKRAALMGGSYGGYMVLAGLAFQRELWAAGVDIVGISNLVTFLENTSSYRRAAREREYGSLEYDREFLESASPITHVDRMRAPLFIIHGANDPRVPLSEAEQIHCVLGEKGIPAELLVYHDEGHGLAKLRNRLDAYPKAVDFLDRVLR